VLADQIVLFLSPQPLISFSRAIRITDVDKCFIVNQSKCLVARGKTMNALAVVADAAAEIVRDAGIKGAAAGTDQHVNEVVMNIAHRFYFRLVEKAGDIAARGLMTESHVDEEGNTGSLAALGMTRRWDEKTQGAIRRGARFAHSLLRLTSVRLRKTQGPSLCSG